MNYTNRSLLVFVLLALAFVWPASSQTAATSPFATFGGGPDLVNLGSLNSHITIPVLDKAGRGQNFNLDLNYDSSMWTPLTSGSTTTWSPANNFGWSGTLLYLGVVLSSTTMQTGFCGPFTHLQQTTTTTYHWSFRDGWGTVHAFGNTSSVIINPCTGNTTTGFNNSAAMDGSGYSLSANGSTVTLLTASNGMVINTNSSGFGSLQDRNGNLISFNGTSYTDTLGTTAVTLSGGPTSSPWKLTYTAPNASNVSYSVNYTNYTVATNFGVSGINEFTSSAAVPLITSIVLPDSSQYSFQYETTPGTCTPKPGSSTCTTSRITKITFPTGGSVSFAYSFPGCTTGINTDGTPSCLQRTVSDGASWTSSWTYAHSGTTPAWTTLINDPQSNQTKIYFQGIYQTEQQVYTGSASSGTLLRDWKTCYNGNTVNCNTTAVSTPITQRNVTDQYGTTGPSCQHIYKYNSIGGLTEQDDYDYPSGSTLLRQVLVTFASLPPNITAFRQQVTVKNGSGTVVAQTNYNYDEVTPASTASWGITQHNSVTGSRGNLTSINYPVSGLTPHLTYYDTGVLNTSQDVNSATTTYNYSATGNAFCNGAFPTSVSEPLSLTRSMTWNCSGGLQLTSVDENGKIVTNAYTDPYFWRPASTTDQQTNATLYGYPSPMAVTQSLTFNGSQSIAYTGQGFDGLGRSIETSHQQSPAGGVWDQVVQSYDSNGRPYQTSVPCVTTLAWTCPTWGQTTTYDALNRVSQVSDAGGGVTNYSYPSNDVQVAVGPIPVGSSENLKERQFEYDSLGRLTSVCEITGLSGSAACGQATSAIGYWTKYTYDALGDMLTVTQNAQAPAASQQARTFTYDAMGRLKSETNPETGTTSYTYDSIASGACAGTYKGDLVKRVDAIGNTTCYTYDSLHRPLSKTYTIAVGGPTVATPNKCFVYDAALSQTVSFPKARLAEAYTTTSACSQTALPPLSSIATDEAFSYTERGELTTVYELTPHSSPSYYQVSQTYWENGALKVLSGNIGLPTSITYGVEGEGRINTVSATGGNPVTATDYLHLYQSPHQLSVTFGSTDSDVFSYDPNTMRMSQYQFNVATKTVTGVLGWNANGSLGSLNISDPFSTANNQNCSFSADDLARISQVNCGSIWGQTFSYDPFGNIQKTGMTGTGGSTFAPCYQSSPSINNRIALVGGTGSNCTGGTAPVYDANGNSTNDTFRNYTWDAENRPVTMGPTGAPVNLTYDALGRAVEQGTGSTFSEIVYSPTGAKLALMSGTTLIKAFVPLPGGATAVYNSAGLAYYRHTDHLGSSRLTSTATQTPTPNSETAYSPFGEPYASSGSLDASFTGQNQDALPGVYDFLFREYDPNQARWTQPDPAGKAAVDPKDPQSWNRYVYLRNRPLRFVDLYGMTCYALDDAGNITDTVTDYDIDNAGDCSDSGDYGGYWIAQTTVVIVNGDDPDSESLASNFCTYSYGGGDLLGTQCGDDPFMPSEPVLTSQDYLVAIHNQLSILPTVCGQVGLFAAAEIEGFGAFGQIDPNGKASLSYLAPVLPGYPGAENVQFTGTGPLLAYGEGAGVLYEPDLDNYGAPAAVGGYAGFEAPAIPGIPNSQSQLALGFYVQNPSIAGAYSCPQ